MFTHQKIYIVYQLGASTSHCSNPTIKICLFGAVTLTKNADIEKYKNSGYGIGFDRRSSWRNYQNSCLIPFTYIIQNWKFGDKSCQVYHFSP